MAAECPVNGGPCKNSLCASGPGCEAEAEKILWLDPGEMEAAIHASATRLGFVTVAEEELFTEYVHDKGLGAGSAGALRTKGPSPF